MKSPSRKSLSRYSGFHGKPSRKHVYVQIRPFTELITLADAKEIVYASNKKNGGGDGSMQKFIHHFGKNVKLYTTPKGDLLLIAGKGMRVTARGIVG